MNCKVVFIKNSGKPQRGPKNAVSKIPTGNGIAYLVPEKAATKTDDKK